MNNIPSPENYFQTNGLGIIRMLLKGIGPTRTICLNIILQT